MTRRTRLALHPAHRIIGLSAIMALSVAGASFLHAQAQPTSPAPSRAVNIANVNFSADDGAVIFATVYGQGVHGVVLAHGGRFTRDSWRPQAETLAKSGYLVLAFDFRGFGKSHGPGDSDLDTAPMHLDVLAAVRYLHSHGAKTVSVIGGSFGGSAAADASIAAKPGEIDRLVLLAAYGNQPAERIKIPLLEIVAQDDANSDGPRLPHIRAWIEKDPQPKKLIVLSGSAHAQFLFQTDHAHRIMEEILRFLRSTDSRP